MKACSILFILVCALTLIMYQQNRNIIAGLALADSCEHIHQFKIMEKYLELVLQALETDIERIDSFHTGIYQILPTIQTQAKNDSIVLQIQDVSSLIHPILTDTNLLLDPNFYCLFLQANMPIQSFIEKRNQGVQINNEMISEDYHHKYWSTYSLINLNTIDLAVLDMVLHNALDLPLADQIFHDFSLFRQRRQIIHERDLLRFNTPEYKGFHRLFTTQPQININTVPEKVLHAFIFNSTFSIPKPADTLSRILRRRTIGSISKNEIPTLLGLTDPHPIEKYLGDKTYFWKIEVQNEKNRLTCITAILPPDINNGTQSPPIIVSRIQE